MGDETFEQRAERIAAEIRKAEVLDEFSGQRRTTAKWVLSTATEMGLQMMEQRLQPAVAERPLRLVDGTDAVKRWEAIEDYLTWLKSLLRLRLKAVPQIEKETRHD